MNEIPISGLPTAGSIDASTSYWPIVNSGVTERINRNTALGLVSAPVGLTDTQTLTNKTLTAPTISSPVLSGTVTGTYTLGGTPTFPASVVTLTGTQTLTNKTLTSPTINDGSISNTTISVDAIAGFSDADSGSIYGVDILNGLITAGSYAAGSIATADLANGSVTPEKLQAGTGTTWVWQSWTPTWTNVTGGTLQYARYSIIGKTCVFDIRYTLNGAGVSGDISVSLPVAANSRYGAVGNLDPMGNAMFRDAGTAGYPAVVTVSSTTVANVRPQSASGSYVSYTPASSTIPFTWTSTDEIYVTGRYETA